MLVVAGLLAAKFVLYCGVLYLLSLVLQMGTPLDSVKAGFHRLWTGASGTMAALVGYMLTRLWGTSWENTVLIGTFLLWACRVAAWAWVITTVYRVTRWRKGKLAVSMAVMLALDFGIDFAVGRLQASHPFLPYLGNWPLQLC